MNELLCHIFGDYVFQNHWMATTKVKSSLAAAVHAFVYTLPFLFLTRSPIALAIIVGTHFLIDRFRLVRLWTQFWGTGCEGFLWRVIRDERKDRLIWKLRFCDTPQNDSEEELARCREWFERAPRIASERYPDPSPTPDFLAVWLVIIVDNAIHLLINHLALRIS